ncbi:MAG: hypothetical protein A2Y33_13795 [Spirochaetes bacterium GWF1_51_8]|nr:MAG: hypothetical protein A2Y33_13795 [Spirochaetes bacterium GWF1_51_8]
MSTAPLSLIIAGAIILGLAIDMLLRSSRKLNIAASVFLGLFAFVVACEGIQGYLLSIDRPVLASVIIRAEYAFLILLSSSFYLFTNHFPRGEYWKVAKPVVYLLVGLSAVFVAAAMLGIDRESTHYLMVFEEGVYRPSVDIKYNFIHYIINGYILLLALYSAGTIIAKIKRVRLVYQKQQIRYFLSGFAVFGAIHLLTLIFANELPPSVKYTATAVGSVVFSAVTFYSIVVYRFGSLRKTLGRLGIEFAVLLVLLVPVMGGFFMVRSWLADLTPALFFLLVTPSMAVVFRIIHLAYLLVLRIIRGDHTGTDATEKLMDRLWNSRDLNELASRTVTLLEEQIECANADFLVYDQKNDIFRVLYSTSGKTFDIPGSNPFFKLIAKSDEYYHRDVINIDPRYTGIKESAEKYFAEYGAQLLLPVFFDNEIPALINISPKIDENSYTSDELGIIRKIRKLVTIITDNLILFEKEEEAKTNVRDLGLATEIQQSIFQGDIPEFEKIDVFAYQKPAKWVSGDYYFVDRIDGDNAAILIADVSGKGIPASLVAMVIHTIAKTQEFSRNVDPIVKKINDILTSNQGSSGFTRISSFATIFCGFLECGSSTFHYTNAGHLPVLVFDRASGKYEYLTPNSKPVGLFPEFTYTTSVKKLKKNQILVLYSDGITEAIDMKDEEFGQERLEAIVRRNEDMAAREIAGEILKAVENFSEGREQFDDITLIVIKL